MLIPNVDLYEAASRKNTTRYTTDIAQASSCQSWLTKIGTTILATVRASTMARNPPYVMIEAAAEDPTVREDRARGNPLSLSCKSHGDLFAHRPLVWPSHSLVGYVMLG